MQKSTQLFIAFVVGAFYYMFLVVVTMYDGFVTVVLLPIAATVWTAIGMGICFVVGLALRLLKSFRWQTKHFEALIIIGVALVVMSWVFSVQVYDLVCEQNYDVPHPYFGISGWLITLFAIMHFPTSKTESIFAESAIK